MPDRTLKPTGQAPWERKEGGGVYRHARVFPIVKMITSRGIKTLPDARLARLY